ncbi:flagellar hook-associated protein FlgK [Sporosalibacterium faouarense]|uniref:flagellar hook-associated protein FlgK n=1 Tax=Sporosalibacterium faouarense TaxID=516123 RepID=UPI00141D5796|nr:flagellar hook-associated protein FlgK [Sporosalibacterium faouarense]MTI46806.1 flagellar hook-associated protein FlgK [Bacillota bacterium]
MSGWVGFNTAVSGLLASQRSLYTTNHNIANANTEGYSRQVAKQRTTTAMILPGIGALGTGTETYDITRIRDEYIDFKYIHENAPLGEWEVKSENLESIENIFNEPSESSFRKNLDEFFQALETLSTAPSDYSNRALVREKAGALTNHLNETAQRLYSLQKELNFAVRTTGDQINDLASQIGTLNDQIYRIEIDGTTANDLRDKRDVLIDDLSKLVNIQTDDFNGKLRVSIGGISLVNHNEVSKLKTTTIDNKYNPEEKLVQIEWETGNQVLEPKSGELKGLLDMRDGDGKGNSYRGVGFYIERLNEFSRKIVEKVNAVHYQGEGLNDSSNKLLFAWNGLDTSTIESQFLSKFGVSLSSVDFNDETDPNYLDYKQFINENVKADNISLSGDILNNLDSIAHIAAASAGKDGVENNENVLKLIELREDNKFFDDTTPQGTPDDFLKAVLSNLAVDGQQSIRMKNNQSAIMANVEIHRQSVSGVSLDEEMSNMVKYQHSYNASARMLTTIDAIYDVTINRLGLVGR